jgi:hypothetical protein
MSLPWPESLDRKVFLETMQSLAPDDYRNRAYLRMLYRSSYPHWPEFAISAPSRARGAIAVARAETVRRIKELIAPLREAEQWVIDYEAPYHHFRWDFRYVDPANGREQQYGVDIMFADEPTEAELGTARDQARACIALELQRKCGDKFLPAKHPLRLSRGVPARFV